MSHAYMLRLEIDLAPLSAQLNGLIQDRGYFLGASARFHVLKGAIEHLMHVRDCVRRRVRVAGRRGRKLTAAASWMHEVERFILAFGRLQCAYDQIPKLFWVSPGNFWRSYIVCKDASQMLPHVTRLCAEGERIIRSVKLPQPMEVSTGFVSRDHTLRTVIARVKEKGGGGIIGIWGRAGLGKTHIMKLIEEYFFRDDSFDLVLRIAVPRDSSLPKPACGVGNDT